MSRADLEKSLLALFEHGRDAMFIACMNGKFTHVNDAFLKLYNFNEDDVIGQPIGMIKSNLHDDTVYQNIQHALEHEGAWSGELRNTSYAGEIIHVWTQMIKTERGYVGIQVDLRERDRTVRQVERTARLESISTLAGGIAHEFNNILAGIQGHMHMLRQSISSDNETDRERIQRIGKLTERAATLVRNMLLFSKQKQTINRETHLSTLLEDTVKLAQPTLPKAMQLQLEINQRGLVILANDIEMKQTLFELISNAASAFDHMTESTLPSSPKIIVRLKQEGDSAIILIRDNGCGMDEHQLRHCMDPFYTTKPVGQGTGLGLSSANSYIKQLGGAMEIESRPGAGTLVRIHLPLQSKTKAVESKETTILLADDDEDVRFSLNEILVAHGYDVLDAKNGVEALDLWQENEASIDAIVMDIVMPQMDGLEVARNIRETGSDTPICMMTGYSNQSVPADLNLHLFRKPIEPEMLLKYLENQPPR